MVLPAISGIISDKIGYDWLVIFFFGLMVLAQGLFAFGCYQNGLFSILITARLLYGIGAESHALVETPLIWDYFKGKELAFALALHLSMGRAGSSLNDICTFLAYSSYNGSEKNKITFATSIGFFILLFFWICIILMILVHRVKVKRKKMLKAQLKREKRRKKKKNKNNNYEPSIGSNTDASTTITGAQHLFDEASVSHIDTSILSAGNDNGIRSGTGSLVAPLIGANELSDDVQKDIKGIDDTLSSDRERNIDIHRDKGGIQNDNFDARSVTSHGTATSKMKLSDIKEFDLVFWLLVWNCAIMYAIVLSWMNIGSDFLQTTYGYSHGTANGILTIPYSLAGVLQPIWGYISDKYGWRSQFLLISSFIFVIAHYMFGWVRIDGNPIYLPVIALTLFGFGYSIFTAVIWPCFPLVVPPRAIGTAYGIPTSGYNLVLTIYYLLVGVFTSSLDNSDKYLNVQRFLLITSIATVVTSLWLLYKDKMTGWRLYPSAFDPPASSENDNDNDN